MDIFVREVRSKVPGVTGSLDKCVFLMWNGETMETSQINKVIKSVWKKAVMEVQAQLCLESQVCQQCIQTVKVMKHVEISQI